MPVDQCLRVRVVRVCCDTEAHYEVIAMTTWLLRTQSHDMCHHLSYSAEINRARPG